MRDGINGFVVDPRDTPAMAARDRAAGQRARAAGGWDEPRTQRRAAARRRRPRGLPRGGRGRRSLDRRMALSVSSMRIAYLVGRYPASRTRSSSARFGALRRLGVDVHCFSIWRTAERELLSPTSTARSGAATDALLPPTPGRAARAHVRALVRAPRGLPRRRSDGRSRSPSPGVRRRALAVTWFVEAIVLWDACRRREVRHIHAHLDGTAPMVALLAVEFANAEPGRRGRGRGVRPYTARRSSTTSTASASTSGPPARASSRASATTRAARSWPSYRRSCGTRLVVVRCGVDLHEFAPGIAAAGRRCCVFSRSDGSMR